jgi:hypothetical protein
MVLLRLLGAKVSYPFAGALAADAIVLTALCI